MRVNSRSKMTTAVFFMAAIISVFLMHLVEAIESLPESRIVHGKEAEFGQFPFVVYVASLDNNTVSCVGTLITKRHVLTAAHCLSNYLSNSYVFLNLLSLWGDNVNPYTTIAKRIISVKQHEDFSYDKPSPDIGIVTLEDDVPDTIKPVVLATDPFVTFDFQDAFLPGWGKTDPKHENASPDLMYANLTILPNCLCYHKIMGSKTPEITIGFPYFLCAEDSRPNVTNPNTGCFGDSGGPLLLKNNVQVAVYKIQGAELENKLCTFNLGIFIRVASFATWIEENTKV